MTTAIEKAKSAVASAPKMVQGETLQSLLKSESVNSRFREVLGKKASGFVSSVLTLANTNRNFEGVSPTSIISSAMVAATLDLPINPNLGFAHIVPYSGRAQFQMGWKGFVQLAIRTGQYKTMNAVEVYESEFKGFDRFTGEINIDKAAKQEGKIVGYYAFFKLTNGFEKSLYMSIGEVTTHAKKYSKAFNSPSSPWQTLFDDMAKKTVLKLLLSKFGILSIELQKAVVADQGVVSETNPEVIEYVDNPPAEIPQNTDSEPTVARKVSALDIQIHQAKKELGEAKYYEILGTQFGVEHMTQLNDGKKEMFAKVLNGAIEMKGQR